MCTANQYYEEIKKYRQQTEENMCRMDACFRQLMEAVTNCSEEVEKALYAPFLKELVWLMHDMEDSRDVYTSRLEYILRSIGMEPIAPASGDAFDNRLHERQQQNHTGMMVKERITKGWKLGDNIMLRAVVTTMEGNGDDDHE